MLDDLPGREVMPGIEPVRDGDRPLYRLVYDKRLSNDRINLVAAVSYALWSAKLNLVHRAP